MQTIYNSISEYFIYLYKIFNKKKFPNNLDIVSEFKPFIDLVYQGFNQEYKEYNSSIITYKCPKSEKNENNKVLLGFSGGLDSVYQYVKLKEERYDVYLYNVKSINKYENGQADKATEEIADFLNIPNDKFLRVNIPFDKNKEWPENPIKNQLILSYMVNWCIDNDIYKVSLGDDEGLLLEDSTPGINFTDAKEITDIFFDCVRSSGISIEYIPLKFVSKLERIEKLKEYNLEDLFYSCITAGRFNRYRHDYTEKKYGIKLFRHNCGCYCRKCAMHNLLMHYGNVQKFPEEFIEKCWKIMYNNGYSSEYKFFNPDLSEKEKIKNLFTT